MLTVGAWAPDVAEDAELSALVQWWIIAHERERLCAFDTTPCDAMLAFL
jgi:hypothetical protein